MKNISAFKADRILYIYFELIHGKILNKEKLAQQFGVTAKSIQRDINSLRCFLDERHEKQDIIYDKKLKGYRLYSVSNKTLSNSEVLAICKILLESRSLRKDELLPIIDKLVAYCVEEQNKHAVQALIKNEKFHYIEPHHGKYILSKLWAIGQAVQKHQMIEIEYERMKEPKLVLRRVMPVGIMFSEYYFYLTAFLPDKTDFENSNDPLPTIYRIDRIQSLQMLEEHFKIPYKNRFEEGEFRKRMQFMYGGKTTQIRFRYSGPSLEAVLDRLPTAEVISTDNEGWIIKAEVVLGQGIEMWLRSQGNYISML